MGRGRGGCNHTGGGGKYSLLNISDVVIMDPLFSNSELNLNLVLLMKVFLTKKAWNVVWSVLNMK